jgi:eukaryotic-like serine/threonine-protein kinase
MLAPGLQLGQYRIIASLGKGGMGEIYRAKDLRLEREVAIKVIADRFLQDGEAQARFEREAKAVAALSHPNIVDIYELCEEEGLRFAVLELLKGETLRRRLAVL